MDRMDQIKDMCVRMEDLCADAGMRRFDRVRLKCDPDELWFLWEEEKRMVIVELSSSPELLASELARATAGDAVLN